MLAVLVGAFHAAPSSSRARSFIVNGIGGRPTGTAFVTFASEQDVAAVVDKLVRVDRRCLVLLRGMCL